MTRKITAFGETHSITKWAAIKGMDRCTLNTRLCRLGWEPERALSTPTKEGWAHREDHGMVKSPEYQTWQGMRDRCNNANCERYKSYGGRGIRVCERWDNSFSAFLADMGRKPSPKHSIDRIDNDGDYEPGNCRWATDHDQRRNKNSNRYVTFRGETKTVTDFCDQLGLRKTTVFSRLYAGWPVERALATPIGRSAKGGAA